MLKIASRNAGKIIWTPRVYRQHRFFSDVALRTFNIAVVGSGPSAFYTILYLLQKHDPVDKLNIDIYEKLPVPFGLSRYGVAPDHPEVKNCEDKFQEIIEQTAALNQKAPAKSEVRFIGNVNIGKDLSLTDLRNSYNAILFAYGCAHDKQLEIKGAESPGIISARKFVGWYNGLPELQDLNPPLDKVEDVMIIGNGNVALDVARVLLSPPEYWEKTDLSKIALETLRKSKVKRVRIVARRGFFQSAFTNKELRELLELRKLNIFLEPLDEDVYILAKLLKSKISRVHKRRLSMLENYFKEEQKIPEGAKTWSLEYLKSPVEVFSGGNNILSAVKLRKNQLQEEIVPGGGPETSKVVPTGETITTKAELLVTSIGFKGLELPTMKDIGIEFDVDRGVIPNVHGRIINNLKEQKILPGLYTTGWIKHGPKGTIASTMMDAFSVGAEMIKDMQDSKVITTAGFNNIEPVLKSNNVDHVLWKDWKLIDKVEKSAGTETGKVREKLVSVKEMLLAAKGVSSG